MKTMKAVVFKDRNDIAVEEVPKPRAGAGEIANRRVDLRPLVTHRFALDDIKEAFDLFSRQGDGVLKVALYPDLGRSRRLPETVGVGATDEQC